MQPQGGSSQSAPCRAKKKNTSCTVECTADFFFLHNFVFMSLSPNFFFLPPELLRHDVHNQWLQASKPCTTIMKMHK